MTEAHMIRLGLGIPGQVHVMAGDAFSTIILPRLQTGILNILTKNDASQGRPGAPPSIPAMYHGTITLSETTSTATRMYARVTKSGFPDLWFSQPLDGSGSFVFPIGITKPGYDNATVQFWINAEHAKELATYAGGTFVELNLTFADSD